MHATRWDIRILSGPHRVGSIPSERGAQDTPDLSFPLQSARAAHVQCRRPRSPGRPVCRQVFLRNGRVGTGPDPLDLHRFAGFRPGEWLLCAPGAGLRPQYDHVTPSGVADSEVLAGVRLALRNMSAVLVHRRNSPRARDAVFSPLARSGIWFGEARPPDPQDLPRQRSCRAPTCESPVDRRERNCK